MFEENLNLPMKNPVMMIKNPAKAAIETISVKKFDVLDCVCKNKHRRVKTLKRKVLKAAITGKKFSIYWKYYINSIFYELEYFLSLS